MHTSPRFGTLRAWSTDLAILGLINGLVCPLGAKWLVSPHLDKEITTTFVLIAALVGLVSGSLLGSLVGILAERFDRRTTGWVAMPVALALFPFWGGWVVGVPTLAVCHNAWMFAIPAGMIAASLQGLWLLPGSFFAFQRGWQRWPIHLVSGVVALPFGALMVMLVPAVIGAVATVLSPVLGW